MSCSARQSVFLRESARGAGFILKFLASMGDSELPVEPVVIRHRPDEQEFVRHICGVLERKMARGGLDLEGHRLDGIIRPKLRDFFWTRAVDAMEWILECGRGRMEFDQDKEDEISVLCRYYNDFITEDGWTEQDHTMMTVLNRYDNIKANEHGNFKFAPVSKGTSVNSPEAPCI